MTSTEIYWSFRTEARDMAADELTTLDRWLETDRRMAAEAGVEFVSAIHAEVARRRA